MISAKDARNRTRIGKEVRINVSYARGNNLQLYQFLAKTRVAEIFFKIREQTSVACCRYKVNGVIQDLFLFIRMFLILEIVN